MKKMKSFLYIFTFFCLFTSCSNFDDGLAKTDFLKKCNDCKIVDVYSEECHDGSILSCMIVKISYTQNSDTVKSVLCQYLKDEDGNWYLSE